MAEHEQNDIILEVEGVTKRFPGVLANDNVSLKLRRGEILALLGENGAGKSTLMNIIYGLYHPDEGTIRLKGQEVHFASPREAIHNGIGMVHQHFQLVNVMTVAENVVLGEEADVAHQGAGNRALSTILKWLPSLVVLALSVILGVALAETRTAVGGVVIGIGLALLVAYPPAARLVWGIVWRVGLAFLALAIASQVELITKVGLTDIALRQEVEIVRERRPQAMDGYEVKVTYVEHTRVPFDWAKEGRAASDAGTGIQGVLASAKSTLEAYRDDGVSGALIDAIDDVPPVVRALSVALLLILLGWHGIASWRGDDAIPHDLKRNDIVALAGLVIVYVLAAAMNITYVETLPRLALVALTALGLAAILWRTVQRRNQPDTTHQMAISPLDGGLDALLGLLHTVTQIRNESLAAQRVRELSQQYGLEVDPDAVIEKLPVGTQQRVEIIKALYRQADVLILDEPTAVLTPQEGRELFKIMRELAAQGVSIIFITHKLKEVFEVASHIVVMRDGRVVGATTPAEATETSLAAMMVGREVILQVEKGDAQPAERVLEVLDLSAYNDRGAKALSEVSFEVRAGEVLGIAGVQGNGQTELVEVLTGLREPSGGSVRLLGREMQPDVQPEAGIGARIGAFLIDIVVVLALTYFFGSMVWYFGDKTFANASWTTEIAAGLLVFVIIDALYFFGSWETIGTTLGMSLFGLQIVRTDDTRAGVLQLIQRYLIFLVLHLPAGIPLIASLVAARSADPPRAWFDRLLGLRVVRFERITPRGIKDRGTSHIPEDRLRHGLVTSFSVADNLVLNDYYERPFAKEPDVSSLPGALLRYGLIFGAIVAALTGIALWVWNEGGLWKAILDLYDVPADLRIYEPGRGLTRDQQAALQYPFLIAVTLLVIYELAAGVIAHLITSRVLGVQAVSSLFEAVSQGLRRVVWRLMGRAGEPDEPDGGLLRDEAAIDEHATHLVDRFDIRTPTIETSGSSLSGGNQQKVIVAREVGRRPRLLIAAQPTRGIDVGSIEFIHNQIIAQRDAGAAVLLVSAELDEIMALSDRIAVLFKGEIIDTLPADVATREELGLLMAGIRNGAPAAGREWEPQPAGV